MAALPVAVVAARHRAVMWTAIRDRAASVPLKHTTQRQRLARLEAAKLYSSDLQREGFKRAPSTTLPTRSKAQAIRQGSHCVSEKTLSASFLCWPRSGAKRLWLKSGFRLHPISLRECCRNSGHLRISPTSTTTVWSI